jgi:hypothetical protein
MSSAVPATTELTALMRAMGSPTGAFDPMPPPQHRFFLDRSQPMTSRAIAWLWSKTIRPSKGHKRSPYARDERGALTLTHAAADLGWSLANASTTFSKLEDEGRIRRDEKGRICLRADVPEPEQTKGEDDVQDLCTQNLPDRLALLFQQLAKTDVDKATRAYFERRAHWKKVQADAMALVRRAEDEDEKRWLASLGLTPPDEARGRPVKKREESLVEIKIVAVDFSVHKTSDDGELTFVQNGDGVSHKTENGSEHKSASLLSLELESLERASSQKPNAKPSQKAKTKTETALARAVAIENDVVETLNTAKLSRVGGVEIDARTVCNMRILLERLHDDGVRAVLDVLLDKATKLAKDERASSSKTWGWLVGLVRGEAQKLTERPADADGPGDGVTFDEFAGIAQSVAPEQELDLHERFVAAFPSHVSAPVARQRIEELKVQLHRASKVATTS